MNREEKTYRRLEAHIQNITTTMQSFRAAPLPKNRGRPKTREDLRRVKTLIALVNTLRDQDNALWRDCMTILDHLAAYQAAAYKPPLKRSRPR